MTDPTDGKPPALPRDQLPDWARNGLEVMHRAHREGDGKVWLRPRRRWQVPEQGLLQLPEPLPLAAVWILGSALWPVGIGLWAWALIGLRADQVHLERWLAGLVAVVLGAFAVAQARRRASDARLEGVLVVPAGLMVVRRAAHHVVAREDIRDFVLEDGRLLTVHGPRERHWCLYAAEPDTPGHHLLEGLQHDLREWLRTGSAPEPADDPTSKDRPPDPLRSTGKLLAFSAALVVVGWLTMVLPATADASRVVRRFVEHVGNRELDAAYGLLSSDARQQLSRATFEAALPPELTGSTGFTANALHDNVGTVVGPDICVDGWLDGIDASPRYAFELVEEGDGPRIVEWGPGQCGRAH